MIKTIIIISIIVIILFFQYNKEGFIEAFTSVKWKRNPQCKYKMSKSIRTLLNDPSFEKSTDNNYDVYLPCSYNNIPKEIKDIDTSNRKQKIFIIDNTDQIAGKNTLWSNIKSYYGVNKAKTMMPNTYILNNSQDMDRFTKDYNKDNLYILKRNVQRQEGLKITKDINTIIKAKKENFVVVQELLQNPYLINGHKMNMRFYVLVICKDNKISCYIHKDGFMYYTKVPFVKNSEKAEHNITTGYIDRRIYDENPLTHDDFRHYLSMNNIDYQVVFNRIYHLIKKIIDACENKICKESKLRPFTLFQLFGADIALDNKLQPQLMEMNKGPDMGAKDERDGALKQGVLRDIFKVIGENNTNNNGFIRVK